MTEWHEPAQILSVAWPKAVPFANGLPPALAGFAVLACGIAATGVAAWRRRRRPGAMAEAGCIAALVALAVHSFTDYLWQIPVIPLTAAVLVGLLLPNEETERLPGV